jgi:hypothetical protein
VPVLCGTGYRRSTPPTNPKLGTLLLVIDAILDAHREAVGRQQPRQRIFEWLRDEYGYTGGYTMVKDHVRLCRACGRKTFVPLAHPPEQAQVDFGEAGCGRRRRADADPLLLHVASAVESMIHQVYPERPCCAKQSSRSIRVVRMAIEHYVQTV